MIKRFASLVKWVLITAKEQSSWSDTLRARLGGGSPRSIRLRNGLLFTAPPENNLTVIVHEIFFNKEYTPGFVKIRKGDIVVDIGANVGAFSVFAASCGASRVIAFEPFPENFACYLENIRANNITVATGVEAAVYDKKGTERLFVSDVSGGHLLFDHNVNGKLQQFIEVKAYDLQSIFDDFGLEKIDFLKIDCEGSEGAILRTAPVDLLQKISSIAMEFHDNVSEPQHEGMRLLLEQAGFETDIYWNGKSDFGYLYARRV